MNRGFPAVKRAYLRRLNSACAISTAEEVAGGRQQWKELALRWWKAGHVHRMSSESKEGAGAEVEGRSVSEMAESARWHARNACTETKGCLVLPIGVIG